MDKFLTISMLMDFYGKLLTQKQYDVLDLHYNNDYSLSEISENLGISRQGVFDNLKRAEKTLNFYEEKLQLVKKFLTQKNNIEDVLNKLRKIPQNNDINNIIDSLECIIADNEME